MYYEKLCTELHQTKQLVYDILNINNEENFIIAQG